MKIYQIKQIRELERLAVERFGISEDSMMQRAGKAACDTLLHLWPKTKCIGVITGSGNNAGDGYLSALFALKRGIQVQVWQVGETQKLTGAALHAFEFCKQAGVPIQRFTSQAKFTGVDVLVDAVLGIGLQGEVRTETRAALEAINQSNLPVLAIDIPSGLNADTGHVHSVAVKATATITFVGMKLGLLTGAGLNYTGQLYSDDLELPSELYRAIPAAAEKISTEQFLSFLFRRPRDYHKGDCGHVLIIGGDYGYSGAVRLAAEAALRTGAGLVSVATRKQNSYVLNIACPEIMCHDVDSVSALPSLLEKANVIVIGPGLGKSKWAKELLSIVVKSDKPLVVDADALNLLAENPLYKSNWILTPHPGEAARLLGTSVNAIQENRLAAVMQLEKKFGGTIVLKGAGSLVAAKDLLPALCNAGNPGMATAGMGDLLTGIIASLVAQGMPPMIGTKLGVCLHAEAGDIVSREGERGMIASDLFLPIRKLVNPHDN